MLSSIKQKASYLVIINWAVLYLTQHIGGLPGESTVHVALLINVILLVSHFIGKLPRRMGIVSGTGMLSLLIVEIFTSRIPVPVVIYLGVPALFIGMFTIVMLSPIPENDGDEAKVAVTLGITAILIILPFIV